MEPVKVLQIKQSVFANNDAQANQLRRDPLRQRKNLVAHRERNQYQRNHD